MMMDLGISGADASVAARTTRSPGDAFAGAGFSDALTSAGDRTRTAADDDGNDDVANRADGASSQPSAQPRTPVPGTGGATGLAGRISARTLQRETDAAVQAVEPPPGEPAAVTMPAVAQPENALADEQTTTAALAAALAAQIAASGKADGASETRVARRPAFDDPSAPPVGKQDRSAATDTLTLLTAIAADASLTAPQAAATAANSQMLLPQPAAGAGRNARSDTADGLAALAGSSVANMPADAGTSVQTVKATRADGRGRAFELSLNGKQDDSLDLETLRPASNVDVTVLDSRRYLGLAAGTNSATVLGTLRANNEWSAAMSPGATLSNQALWTSTGKVVNVLKIQLHPQDLGTVTATMRLSGDQLSVDLKVQSGEAYRQLSGDQGHMLEALRSQGYAVDTITVTHSTADSAGSGAQQRFQGQQQETANQGQGGGEAQARRQSYSGQRANGNEGVWNARDTNTIDGAGSAAQRTWAGGMYV